MQKSQKFETFWIHVMQATKNPIKSKQPCIITYSSNVIGNTNPIITLKHKPQKPLQEQMFLHKRKPTFDQTLYNKSCVQHNALQQQMQCNKYHLGKQWYDPQI